MVVVVGAGDQVHAAAGNAGRRQPFVHVRQPRCRGLRIGAAAAAERQRVGGAQQRPVRRQACRHAAHTMSEDALLCVVAPGDTSGRA